MANREEMARRVLQNREYFADVQRVVALIGVKFDHHQRCIGNTYYKYVLFREGNQIYSIRGHNEIGKVPDFDHLSHAEHNGSEDFDRFIDAKARELGFHKVDVQYVNAKHLASRCDLLGSRLSEAVQNLLMRLLDEYMPIGILDIDQISEAEDILNDVERSLDANEQVDINLSKEFYQCIPQNDFVEPIESINGRRAHQSKRDALDQLRSALETIHESLLRRRDPIDHFTHNWLRTELKEIAHTSVEFSQLNMCFLATQHNRFFKLANAFTVASSADNLFADNMPNQCLLYHFVFPCKTLGILRDGLQVSSSQMYNCTRFLEDGFYFLDCASLALDKFKDEVYKDMPPVLLVCRVARGTVHNVDFNAGNNLPLSNGMNSFFCKGKEFSGVASQTVNFRNAKMYCGEVEGFTDRVSNKSNQYNVYMVENRHQVKIEYILQFEREML